MATIARLVTVIEAQTAGIEKAVSQIDSVAKSAENTVSVVGTVGKALAGAFTVGAIVNYAQRLAEFASEMQDMSARTGIGVERLQGLSLAAKEGGVSIDSL